MIDFHQQSYRQATRAFGARALVVALGLTVGAAPVALASSTSISAGHGVSSGKTTVYSSKRTVKSALLPPVALDKPLVALPPGVTLSQAQGWLSQVILVRQTALMSLTSSLMTDRMIQPTDRVQLTAFIDATMARLNAIATDASGDTSVITLRHQAEQVMNLQVFNATAPQVHFLTRVDILIGLAAQLSTKESSAAAAIAISRATSTSLRSEQTLDQTVKSLAQAITSELQSTQAALFALPRSSDTDAAAFTNAKIALSTASAQLRLANTDLRNLVVQLVGR